LPAPRPPDAPFRPNLYVVARFLDCLARPDTELTRSQLQAAVGVNYDVFRRYLAFLSEKGYVTVVAKGEAPEVVLLTVAGRRVREELLGWIRRFLGETSL
jgi:predicted transcriptional regulator